MPNIYEELGHQSETENSQVNPPCSIPTKIRDSYNPLVEGNAEKPEFYEDLYKVYTISKNLEGKSLKAVKHIDKEGKFRLKYAGADFEEFKKKINVFSVRFK